MATNTQKYWAELNLGGYCGSPICVWYRIKMQAYTIMCYYSYATGFVMITGLVIHFLCVLWTTRMTPRMLRWAGVWWTYLAIQNTCCIVFWCCMSEDTFATLDQKSVYPEPQYFVSFYGMTLVLFCNIVCAMLGMLLMMMWPEEENSSEEDTDTDEDDLDFIADKVSEQQAKDAQAMQMQYGGNPNPGPGGWGGDYTGGGAQGSQGEYAQHYRGTPGPGPPGMQRAGTMATHHAGGAMTAHADVRSGGIQRGGTMATHHAGGVLTERVDLDVGGGRDLSRGGTMATHHAGGAMSGSAGLSPAASPRAKGSGRDHSGGPPAPSKTKRGPDGSTQSGRDRMSTTTRHGPPPEPSNAIGPAAGSRQRGQESVFDHSKRNPKLPPAPGPPPPMGGAAG